MNNFNYHHAAGNVVAEWYIFVQKQKYIYNSVIWASLITAATATVKI